MRKFLVVLLAVAVLLSVAAPAYALTSARRGLQTSTAQEATAVVYTDPTWVYGITIWADESNSYMAVCNEDTLAETVASTVTILDEIGEASQYESATEWYPIPKYFSDGVSVIIFTGVGFIHKGPAPTNN